MISIETILSLMQELLRVKSVNSVTIHIYRIDDTKFNLFDLSKLLKCLRVLFQSLSTPVNFFFKCPIRELSGGQLEGTTLDLI